MSEPSLNWGPVQSVADYGMRCFQAGCEHEIVASSEAEVEQEAVRRGWVMRHLDGQGYYACPDHANCLWDASPLASFREAPNHG